MRYALLFLLVTGTMAAAQEALPKRIESADGSTMVLVEAGPFVMGTGAEKPEEGPPHTRELPAFYIDETEVTNAQYAAYLQDAGTEPPAGWNSATPPAGREAHPITNISWFEAVRYAAWAGKRLPSEAEWEKAARGTDGRTFPWGRVDDESLRNIKSNHLEPVGSRPGGASPYGVLGMCGNAWEWTADWYEAYPGAEVRAVHFGGEYKTVRGGGGEYLYGAESSGRTTERAYLPPYGAHDFVGFRCAMDAPGALPPYGAEAYFSEAQDKLDARLATPRTLAYEADFGAYLKEGVPLTIDGQPGQTGEVRAGLPLPEGAVQDATGVTILDANGRAVPAQMRALATWPGGSIRWLLATFQAKAGSTYALSFESRGEPQGDDIAAESGDVITLQSSTLTATVTRGGLFERIEAGGAEYGPLALEMTVNGEGGASIWTPLPAETFEVRENGPLHATVYAEGPMADGDGGATDFRYALRIHAEAGAPRLRALLTLTHMENRAHDDLSVMERVADLRAELRTPRAQGLELGVDDGRLELAPAALSLMQPDDVSFTVTRDGGDVAQGNRAPGWVRAETAGGAALLGCRYFWQNHPKALYAEPGAIGVRLWAGDKPFEWEGTLAKTHELILDFGEKEGEVHLDPLRVSFPPEYFCGTEAFGKALPFGVESLERFAHWEAIREWSMAVWVAGMPYGFRHFGDGYMGGPYKGKNAYMNLEYDVSFNMQWRGLRTGNVRLLRVAEAMAHHQADIDTNHVTGQPWKHSPLHTTTAADLGHMFIKGLLLHHLLTGEERSLEVAMDIGDHIAERLMRDDGTGNERQIGWSLVALTPLYEFTGEERYLEAAEHLCDRLIAGQAPTGKFDIRWDNRIAFFNGIAMNGMASVYDITGDQALKDGILRVARRTWGMYPEYAARTLNAYAWAIQQTGDPRHIDILERTWETTLAYLAFNMERNATITATHAWRFMRFGAMYDLLPLFAHEPASLPNPETWRWLRLHGEEAELYLRPATGEDGVLLCVREGQAAGAAELLRADGSVIETFELGDSEALFEPAVLNVPASEGVCRLRLKGAGVHAWQAQYDGRLDAVIYDPEGDHFPALLPRAYGLTDPDEDEVRCEFTAEGEGYHAVVARDASGAIADVARLFIDFEDPGRYGMEVTLPATGEQQAVSLAHHDVDLAGTRGLSPYWAASKEELFHPEQVMGE